MESYIIITEKPSAGRNFAKALGGTSGTFDGHPYHILHLRGHILAHESPEKTAYDNHRDDVGPFTQTHTLPWSHTWFDFNKRVIPQSVGDFGVAVLSELRDYLKKGYLPIIASDIDAMGEGDLLVQEVLIQVGYTGTIYREYHVDEQPASILKALREKKDVTKRNDGYLAGYTRMVLDFLTQQMVRKATMRMQEEGFRLPRPVPVGRLQSVILRLVGEQTEAVNAYTPSSQFESRYKLDSLVLTNPNVPRFATLQDWQPGDLPALSGVKEVKQVPGVTKPPKPLSLTGLSKLLSRQGIPAKRTAELSQKLYDAGILSYPRTEDTFLTPEQFAESVRQVDAVAGLLGLPASVFTHRTARDTHVKEGGSHGALRPGAVLPGSLSDLDARFGQGAGKVYQTVADRFLMMFLEDTEWIRHEYVTTDTKEPFTGSVRIITKKGVVDPEEETTDVADTLPNLGKKAQLYAHEVKSVKPKAPTESWLLGQLEKQKVGTPATQVSTVARLIGRENKFPLLAGKSAREALTLSPIGNAGYRVAKVIFLGTADCTRYFEKEIRSLVGDQKTQEDIFLAFTEVLRKDIETLSRTSFDLSDLGFLARVEGTWNGDKVQIPNSACGHSFTQEELDRLFAGESVTFMGKDFSGKEITVSGKLGYVWSKGKRYVGFLDDAYCYGKWNGEEIRFKRSFGNHRFSEGDCQKLLSGETIQFPYTGPSGQTVSVTGHLERQTTASGIPYVGVKATFPAREGYVSGTFQGKPVTIKGSFSDHVFTKDELAELFAGKAITITFTGKDGQTKEVSGKLGKGTYNGKSYVGFQAQFPKRKTGKSLVRD